MSCSPFVATLTVMYNKTEAFFPLLNISHPIPLTALSEAWFCARSLAGIAGSNPAGVMDICE